MRHISDVAGIQLESLYEAYTKQTNLGSRATAALRLILLEAV
jgi:hypothetical protein